jgi:membrane associated rhomboid family serine protease
VFIPIADVIPGRRTPVVTLALMGLYAAAFLVAAARGSDALVAAGVADSMLDACWRIARASAVHTGWMHLGSNLAALWLFGRSVEDRMGRGRFLVFYLLGAIASAVTQRWAAPSMLAGELGASGAVAGVLAAYAALYPTSRVLVLFAPVVFVDLIEIPAVVFLAFWLLIQLIVAAAASTGLGLSIPFPAYVAGMAWGAATVRLFRRPVVWT